MTNKINNTIFNKFIERVSPFFLNPKKIFILGALICIGVTFSEVIKDRDITFSIFAESTKLFWQQLPPYGANWSEYLANNLDYFLYGPLFNVIFTPFAFLPEWLGPFAWNLFNYVMWFLAIFSMPSKIDSIKITRDDKCIAFLFTLLILATTQLNMQYNVAVGYIYLFAFTLLERGKAFWAIFLIMISSLSKIYGMPQLAMLLFYPKFFRNLTYIVPATVILLLLPLISFEFTELPTLYSDWIGALGEHKDTRVWSTIFYLKPFTLLNYQLYIQIGTLLLLAVGVFINYKKWNSAYFRLSCMAILMSYILLFSNSCETHTYVIALIGYQFWYRATKKLGNITLPDKILSWLLFIVVVLVPIDVICPKPVMHLLIETLQINMWLLIIMWLRICYTTFTLNRYI